MRIAWRESAYIRGVHKGIVNGLEKFSILEKVDGFVFLDKIYPTLANESFPTMAEAQKAAARVESRS